ncbi:MAG: hypothetical protein AAGA30_06620 [Planctomycetota bacterium]
MTVLNNQKCVRVKRQLEKESAVLAALQEVCDAFSKIVVDSTSKSPEPVNLGALQESMNKLTVLATDVQKSRQAVMELIREGNPEMTIRQFIQQAPSPFRETLEETRRDLIGRVYEAKSQMAGDSSVVFYSFDFYRRIINGFVDRIEEEQNYDQNGKPATTGSGKLIQRAC